MSTIPLGADGTAIATGAIDFVSNIVSQVGQTKRSQIESDTAKALLGGQSGVSGGAGISGYIPWIAGGIAGIAVLFFVMKR